MLRTVKLLDLVAMFLVALSSSAQVTTSALAGVVTDENHQAMIGAKITALPRSPGIKYKALFSYFDEYAKKYSKEISQPICPHNNDVDRNTEMMSESNEVVFFFIILVALLFVTVIIIVALCKDKNIKFKYGGTGIDFEIFSKKEKRE